MPALDPSHQLSAIMTVEVYDNGESLYPVVSFKPVGRLTANFIEKYLGYIYSRIQIAQVEARTGIEGIRAEGDGVSVSTPRRVRQGAAA